MSTKESLEAGVNPEIGSRLLQTARFIVDSEGHPTAAVIEFSVWEELLKALEVLTASRLDAQHLIRMPSVRLTAQTRRPEVTVEVEP
ncbi:MAG: hypothetical protein ACFLMY_08170 [Candidatus Brachytrichaceae bacterium NZ_4S206]|jgi:hypothetical protein